MIIRDSMSLGGEGVSNVSAKWQAVGKNSENMSSKIHNFSIMQNIRMHYELNKRFQEPKRTEAVNLSQLVRKTLRKVIKR